jgi:hypothetical protein
MVRGKGVALFGLALAVLPAIALGQASNTQGVVLESKSDGANNKAVVLAPANGISVPSTRGVTAESPAVTLITPAGVPYTAGAGTQATPSVVAGSSNAPFDQGAGATTTNTLRTVPATDGVQVTNNKTVAGVPVVISAVTTGTALATENGATTAIVNVTGPFVASFYFAESLDGGTTWKGISATPKGQLGAMAAPGSVTFNPTAPSTNAGLYQVALTGDATLGIVVSSYTSGSLTAQANLTSGSIPPLFLTAVNPRTTTTTTPVTIATTGTYQILVAANANRYSCAMQSTAAWTVSPNSNGSAPFTVAAGAIFNCSDAGSTATDAFYGTGTAGGVINVWQR